MQALGALRDCSSHWLMKTAIAVYLDREEAYEREKQEDQARWEQYQLTGHAVGYAAVSKWLEQLADGNDMPCPR